MSGLAGGIGTGPGVIPMDHYGMGGGGGQFSNRGRGGMARGGGPAFPFPGVRPGGYGGSRDSRPSHAKSDRERHIDGDDDDYSPPPFTNGDGWTGGQAGRGGYQGSNRGFFNGNRGGYQQRGGYNNFRGNQQQYNRFVENTCTCIHKTIQKERTLKLMFLKLFF